MLKEATDARLSSDDQKYRQYFKVHNENTVYRWILTVYRQYILIFLVLNLEISTI